MNRNQLASIFALFSLALIITVLVIRICPGLKCIPNNPPPTPPSPPNEVQTATPTATPTATLTPTDTTGLPMFYVGLVSDKTGLNSPIGLIQEISARVAISIVNRESEQNGFRLKLLYGDTKSSLDPTFLIGKIDSLMNQRALYIIGLSLSIQTNIISNTIKSECLPLIGASNTGPGIPDLGDCNLRVSAPISEYVGVVIEYIKSVYRKKENPINVAIAYAEDDQYFVRAEVEAFKSAIDSNPIDMKVVTTTTFLRDTSKFDTQVNTICQSEQPDQCNSDIDLVIVSGLAASGGTLIKALREHGYTGEIIGGNGLNTPGLFSYCGLACEGVFFAVAYSHLAQTKYNTELNEVYKNYSMTRGDNPHPDYPLQFTAQTFTAVQVIAEALKQINANPATPIRDMELGKLREAVKNTLLSGNFRIETPLGPISLDANGEIKQEGNFCVAQIQEMRENKLKTEQPFTGKFVIMRSGDGCVPS